jgi:hypothetical protein
MGGCTFMTEAKGETAQAAFNDAVKDACFENGHGGYTGTIAEKQSFVIIPMPTGHTGGYADYANQLIEDGDPRIDDKWGPAGCIDMGLGHYLFFGWASS